MISMVFRLSDAGAAEMDQSRRDAMEEFLRSRELRALRMAEIATRNRDEALDLVQDAMFRLARKYGHKPEAEWAPLFQRILQTRILDWHRKNTLQRRWFMSTPPDTEESPDVHFGALGDARMEPDRAVSIAEQQDRMIAVLSDLPLRQQQAFLLRSWEGLSTRETADAMGCSEGSVKTHFHRASSQLKQVLGEFA